MSGDFILLQVVVKKVFKIIQLVDVDDDEEEVVVLLLGFQVGSGIIVMVNLE